MQETEFRTGVIHPIECVKEAFAAIKDEYWMLFAVSIVGALIGGVTMYVLIGPMICGIYICYLKKFDGKGPVRFDDLWIGFQYFGRSLLVTVLIVVPIVAYVVTIFATIYGPLIMKAVGGNKVSDDELLTTFGVAIVVDLIVALAMVCIHSLLIFSFPLIVDRGLSSWEAIKLSARAALKNAGGIGGLIVVSFILAVLGELACGIGLYLMIPILTASNVMAYRKVFPALTAGSLDPPPPTAYSELA
ncbi:MAG: hypothetical protein JO053_05350 [Acidobacteria bacterium]|nr:hypothetical protein [Acidobacteriota bacterium]